MSSFQSLAPWIRSPSQRTAPNKRTSCFSCLNKDFSSFPICACCVNEPITLSLGIKDHCPFCSATKPASYCSCRSLCSRLLLLWGCVVCTVLSWAMTTCYNYTNWSSLLLLVLGTHSSCTEERGRRGLILFSFATTIHPSRVLYEEIRRQFGGWWGSFGCIVL